MNWTGVMPAMTTPFDANLAVDHTFLARHATWLLENGCKGLVMLGSLGEGATLEHDEKLAVLKTAGRDHREHVARLVREFGEGERSFGVRHRDSIRLSP